MIQMCNKHSTRHIPIQGKTIRVDGCMANIIKYLNDFGIETKGCCCGHGRYPMTIVVEANGKLIEIVSGKTINRTRRFYLTDSDGLYFVPETII